MRSLVCYLICGMLVTGLLSGIARLTAYADGPETIFKIQSGLVASDSLTSADGNTGDWEFNGSATEMSPNAPHAGYENSQGMHIDVAAREEGAWAGYFAISPLTAAKLFHAKVIIPDQRPATGLTDIAVYVQQEMFQDPRIDAMGCGADIYPNETRWTISLQAGDKDKEIVAQTIYSNNSSTSPNARECTLVTNGSNELTAYIDGQKVFSSTSMNLNMPAPFEYYIETQTNSKTPSTGEMFMGTFTDYYATTSPSIKVTNVPPNSIVRVVNATSGDTLASVEADSAGIAFLDVGKYHMPIDASVMVFDSSGGNLLASTVTHAAIYGGDVFNVGSPTPSTTTLTVSSVDSAGNPLDGQFVEITNGKTTVASGFTPLSFEGLQDSTYYILVQDDDTHIFDHWDDGTRFRAMLVTPTAPSVTATAHYVDNPGLAAPQSLTSTSPYTTKVNTPTITGTADSGLSVRLYDGLTPIGDQVTVPPSGVWSITTPAMPDGRHSIFAEARNSTVVSPLSTPITMTVDTALPSLSITNTAVAAGQVSLTGASSDSLSGIRVIEVGIDGDATSFKAANPLVFGDWSSWTFTTSHLSPGSHRITARATDVAGNQASASIDVTIPFVAPPGQSLIAVNAVDSSGNAINGLYTVLQYNNSVSGTDFTPSAFTVNDGLQYVVTISNYGPYYFDHWQDNGSTDSHRTITTTGATVPLIAVYRDTPLPPPPSGKSMLTVNAIDSSGNLLEGMYTTLGNSGSLVSAGFTAAHFTIDDGQDYVVSLSDYGSHYFDHWQDTGSTARQRTVSANSDLSLTAVYRNTPLPPPPSGKSALDVISVDSAGNAITGLYTILSRDGVMVDTEFTPSNFMLDDGQPYAVSVSDYGSHYFDHWQDDGSTARTRTVTTAGSALSLVAAYRDTPLPPPPAGKSSVTVSAADSSDNLLPGLYTTLSQNGATVSTGFTAAHFTLDDGTPYSISVSDYGSHYFDHWPDTGSTTRARTITTSGSPVSLTAIYRDTPLPPPPSGQSALTVSSVDSAGNPVTGMYTTVSQNGNVVSTGFTPFHLTIADGQQYVVSVSNYGAIVFNHWQDDGSTSNTRTVTAAGSPLDLVAVYNTG